MKMTDATRFEKIVGEKLRRAISEKHSQLVVLNEEKYPQGLRMGALYSPDFVVSGENEEKMMVIELVDSNRFDYLSFATLNKMRAIRDAFRDKSAEVVLLTPSKVSPSMLSMLESVEHVTVIQEVDTDMAVEKLERKLSELEVQNLGSE